MIIAWGQRWNVVLPGDSWVAWQVGGKIEVVIPDVAPPPTFLVYVPKVTVQEPPYDGPFDRELFASPPFAVTNNPRTDEIRWCEQCRRPVVVDHRPFHWHKHFDQIEHGEEVGR